MFTPVTKERIVPKSRYFRLTIAVECTNNPDVHTQNFECHWARMLRNMLQTIGMFQSFVKRMFNFNEALFYNSVEPINYSYPQV